MQVYDGLHGGHQRILALLHGIDETLCGIHFLFEEHHGFAGLLRLIGPVLGVFFHHLGEVAAHAQFRYVAVVQCHVDGTVVISVYQEVGHNLLHVLADGFAERGTGTGIQLADFLNGLLQGIFADT